jgi:hypothetical protein
MIRVDRSKVERPAILDQPYIGGTWSGKTERERVCAFYAQPENRDKAFPFRRYSHRDVGTALGELFHRKCAYCESKYAPTQPVAVEHYRPKGMKMVEAEGGKLVPKRPGYYWLASEWDNLLPSCTDCNSARYHEFPNGRMLLGKGNRFPIKAGSPRAENPGDEVNEVPLLLNPCDHRPEGHLEFTEEGVVRPALTSSGQESRMGSVSIEVYGLRRPALVQARRDRAILIKAWIDEVEDDLEALQQEPDDTRAEVRLERHLRNLREYLREDKPYLAMAQQMVKASFPDSIAAMLIADSNH